MSLAFKLIHYLLAKLTVLINEISMDTISYTAARANLAKIIERVCNDRAPVGVYYRR